MRTEKICSIDGCDNVQRCRTWCNTHYTRWLKHGDTNTVRCRTRAEEASYECMHYRIFLDRGSAKNYSCIDCGGQAHDWSYDHNDPNERTGGLCKRPTATYTYSLDPQHYAPRCRKCHIAFDQEKAGLSPVCAISDCGRARKSLGYCSGHYARLRRHGHPLKGGPAKQHAVAA